MAGFKVSNSMIVGLSAGFAACIGLMIFCCMIWRCFCSTSARKKSKETKIGPWSVASMMPPLSERQKTQGRDTDE